MIRETAVERAPGSQGPHGFPTAAQFTIRVTTCVFPSAWIHKDWFADSRLTSQGFALISLRDMGVEEVRSQESMASAVEAASPETRTKFSVSAGITDYAFSRTAPRKSGPSGATQHKESKLVPATSQIFCRCIRAKRLTAAFRIIGRDFRIEGSEIVLKLEP